MASIRDSYNTGDNGSSVQNAVNDWESQTFTPSENYDIISVKIKIYRQNTPGTITVEIQETTGGEPNGSVLAIGTINGNAIQETYQTAIFEEITFGTSYTLVNGTKYAIVIKASTASGSNILYWRLDSTSPTYAGGSRLSSTNGGSSWSEDTSRDFMFETWGNTIMPSNVITYKRLVVVGNDQVWYEDI